MPQTRTTRKEREKLTHRQEILEAALNLFSSKGFHNVSMQEIASKSEFAVGTLYNFFESKESLFEGLINHFGEKMLTDVTGIVDGQGSEMDRLIAFIRYQPELLEKYSEIIRLYISVVGTQTIAQSKIKNNTGIKEIIDLKLTSLIEQGINKGLIRSVDPNITAKAIISTIERVSLEIAGSYDKVQLIETFSKIEHLFIDVLLMPENKNAI